MWIARPVTSCQNLEQFVDVLRSVAAWRVLAISPHGLNAGARVLPGRCSQVGLPLSLNCLAHWTSGRFPRDLLVKTCKTTNTSRLLFA